MAWTDWLFGSGALKKAEKIGDAAPNTPQAADPIPNYVEDQVRAQQGKPGENDSDTAGDTPVPATPGPKKQPRVGFRPKKKQAAASSFDDESQAT